MKPNANNFCGGNFQDWLEVNLTDKCNGKCEWCIEKDGYHPTEIANVGKMAMAIINSTKMNIVLLGGEPTLYPYLKQLLACIVLNKNVYITTNGSKLTKSFIQDTLVGIKGINLSIHNYNLAKNRQITGIMIRNLKTIVETCKQQNIKLRLNCNCISGHICSRLDIMGYIEWASKMGIKEVRFSELKNSDRFVSIIDMMPDVFTKKNYDPFTDGCHKNVTLNGVNVNFRLMCGLQTPYRKKPINPEQYAKQVLYYDGKIYKGWMSQPKESVDNMDDKKLIQLLKEVSSGDMTTEEAFYIIKTKSSDNKTKKTSKSKIPVASSSGCVY